MGIETVKETRSRIITHVVYEWKVVPEDLIFMSSKVTANSNCISGNDYHLFSKDIKE